MSKQESITKRRRDQLLYGTGNYFYGADLMYGFIRSARLLLVAASEERVRAAHIEWAKDNYPSDHGPGAIILMTVGFECFLNGTLHDCLFMLPGRSPPLVQLVKDDSFYKKFRDLLLLVAGTERLENRDLWMVHEIRNELVHHYPRHVGTKSNVPEWLEELAGKELLMKSPIASGDFGWQTKLQSYRLALWCAEVIVRAADQ